jgi:hypothetical protein
MNRFFAKLSLTQTILLTFSSALTAVTFYLWCNQLCSSTTSTILEIIFTAVGLIAASLTSLAMMLLSYAKAMLKSSRHLDDGRARTPTEQLTVTYYKIKNWQIALGFCVFMTLAGILWQL